MCAQVRGCVGGVHASGAIPDCARHLLTLSVVDLHGPEVKVQERSEIHKRNYYSVFGLTLYRKPHGHLLRSVTLSAPSAPPGYSMIREKRSVYLLFYSERNTPKISKSNKYCAQSSNRTPFTIPSAVKPALVVLMSPRCRPPRVSAPLRPAAPRTTAHTPRKPTRALQT